jgi:hypothetical protein
MIAVSWSASTEARNPRLGATPSLARLSQWWGSMKTTKSATEGEAMATTAASVVDHAGQAGGIDEVARIAERGFPAEHLSEQDMADLLEAHGSPAEALYAIQREAQSRVSAASI